MVRAVLHVICGNCGSNDIVYEPDDTREQGTDITSMTCQNCDTMHFLRYFNELKKEQ